MPAGIYVHVPFCVRKCPYCDFYSVTYGDETAEKYMDAVRRSFGAFPALAADTLYFGGGTPSLLSPKEVAKTVDAAAGRFHLGKGSEITLEANPASVDASGLRAIRTAGVNRLSVGVQSLDDRVLEAAGRLHSGKEAARFVEAAAASGFENISADVMLGLQGDSLSSLERTLRGLCRLPLTHVSAYMLKLMPGTPFYSKPPANIADDEAAADMYELCCDVLESEGFRQYEISNFARNGLESRHNLKYWQCEDYVGTGAAAHSCISGERYSFPRDLSGFIDIFSEDVTDFREAARYEGKMDAEDMIMLALRTTKGLNIDELYNTYGIRFNHNQLNFIESCCGGGLAAFDGETLKLTRKGFLVSNEIIARLI